MKKILFLLIICFLFVPRVSLAAILNLSSSALTLPPGQLLRVDCMLDTQLQEVNAVEGLVEYPTDLLRLEQIIDGGSIINFWVEKPRLENSQIKFSGIIPGGYVGNTGRLFSLRFTTKTVADEKTGVVSLAGAKVLLNDGAGTETKTVFSNLVFTINSRAILDAQPVVAIVDHEQPEKFSPLLVKDENVSDGKYFVVFAAQDKLSGVDHYEVLETKKSVLAKDGGEILPPASDDWKIAESPFVLSDQSLASYVYIKAVDQSGNSRVALLLPSGHPAWYEEVVFWVIIVGLAIIIFGLFYLRKKRV